MSNRTQNGHDAPIEEDSSEAAKSQETPSPDPPAAERRGIDDGALAYITALQADLEEARFRVEEAEKRQAYALAEFQNVSRRREEQYRSDLRYANSELIKSLLPVLDNLERAIKASEQNRNYDALIGGVSGTLKQLQTALERAGVRPIEALGNEFDPNFHEAIEHVESADLPPNTVAEEIQRGYIMHDRVLRPTLVKVSGA